MEPSPASVSKRTLLAAVILALVAPLGACQRVAELPAQAQHRGPQPSAAPQAPVDGRSPQIGTAGLHEEAAAGVEARKREVLASLESPPHRPADRAPDEAGPPLSGLVAKSDDPAQSGDGTPQTAAKRPDEATLPPEPDPSVDQQRATEPPLPPPLVDDPGSLQRLHPAYPVWIDPQRKRVLMVGRICQRRAPLELFACLRHSKEHESVVVVDTKAYVVHAGLLATGAEPGTPVRFDPEFAPPSGTEIEVTVIWEDESGRRREARAQDWVRGTAGIYTMFEGVVANPFDEELNLDDQFAAWKDMEYPWVFAGSQFLQDDRTGRQYYQADVEGDLICVSNFPSAVLDVPIQSTDSNAALLFAAYTERIPPIGTPVTIVLAPKLGKPAGHVNRSE